MHAQFRFASGLVLALASLSAGTDNPFVGSWKLNPAKSNFAGQTMKFTRTTSGTMEFSAAGMSYTFKMDGQEVPALLGQTAAWKEVDANTWETTYKLNGKVLRTDTLKLAADGKTLTVTTTGTKPNGEDFEDTSLHQRVSGEGGLVGTWRSKEVKISAPNVIEFAPYEGDGLSLKVLSYITMQSAMRSSMVQTTPLPAPLFRPA